MGREAIARRSPDARPGAARANQRTVTTAEPGRKPLLSPDLEIPAHPRPHPGSVPSRAWKSASARARVRRAASRGTARGAPLGVHDANLERPPGAALEPSVRGHDHLAQQPHPARGPAAHVAAFIDSCHAPVEPAAVELVPGGAAHGLRREDRRRLDVRAAGGVSSPAQGVRGRGRPQAPPCPRRARRSARRGRSPPRRECS